MCQKKQRQCHIQNKPEIFGASSDSHGEMLVFFGLSTFVDRRHHSLPGKFIASKSTDFLKKKK